MKISQDLILNAAEKMYPSQVKWYHRLHRMPELSYREFETTKFIKRELSRNGIKMVPLKMKTGVVALVKAGSKTAVAVRSDMDALPIMETTSLSYKSTVSGVMHACGHDIHMAVVLGAAIILNRMKTGLPGTVKFLFQPAEESPPGGASDMIREGVLARPDVKMIFGLHTDPTLPIGTIGLRDGATMASVTDFDITIVGKGGHAARPHLATDAIAVAAELVSSMQLIVSREIDPLQPIVITFGSVAGGRARNVIADEVILRGTARTLSLESRRAIPGLIRRTVDGICRARGAGHKLDFIAGYPVLANHPEINRILADSCTELFGGSKVHPIPQVMGGEDFSFFLERVPGAMFRLGVKNRRIGAVHPWHSSNFRADERSIFYGTAVLVAAVLKGAERLNL